MKQKLLFILVVFLGLCSSSYAQNFLDYQFSEGILSPGHKQEMQWRRKTYFYNEDGSLSVEKMKSYQEKLSEKIKELEPSVQLTKKTWMILYRGYSEEDAEKSAKKEKEVFLAFDLAIETIQEVIEGIQKKEEPKKIKNLVELALLYTSVCDTLSIQNFLSTDDRIVRNALHLFHDIPLHQKNNLEASNLLYRGEFQSQDALKKLEEKGVDLSTLDPPKSAFWNGSVPEKYSETYQEDEKRNIIPPEGTEFVFKRMSTGSIKMKVDWFKTIEGEEKDFGVDLRVGKEIHTQVLTTHLARALGYPAAHTAYRKNVKVRLGETSYDEFAAQWRNTHANIEGGLASYVEKFIPEENAIVLREVQIEAYPDKLHEEVGVFLSGRNGFQNRREYRAQLALAALINLSDTADHQQKMSIIRKDKKSPWIPQFYLADLGFSMGSQYHRAQFGNVNQYETRIVEKKKGFARILWNHIGFQPESYRTATENDIKWLVRRMARLTPEGIFTLFDQAGYPAPVRDLYIEKFKRRINNFIEAFELSVPQYEETSFHKIHLKHKNYISPEGRLLYQADQMNNSTARHTGFLTPTPEEAIQIEAFRFFSTTLSQMSTINTRAIGLNEPVSLGSYEFSAGPKISASRILSINPERGEHQYKFLIEDRATLLVPAGVMKSGNDDDVVESPISFFYRFDFVYYHSRKTIKDTFSAPFFNRVIPTSVKSLQRDLAPGEALRIAQKFEFQAGGVQIHKGQLYVDVAPLGASENTSKEIFLSKTNDGFLEALTLHGNQKEIKTGLDLEWNIRFSLQQKEVESLKKWKYYRFELDRADAKEIKILQEAWFDVLFKNSFLKADQVALHFEIQDHQKTKEIKKAFFWWGSTQKKSDREIEVKDVITKDAVLPVLARDHQFLKVIQSEYTSVHDRTFQEMWKKNLEIGATQGTLNYIGQALDEKTGLRIRLESELSSDEKSFEDSKLWISVSRLDRYASQEELKKEFIDFFNQKSNSEMDPSFFQITLGPEVKYYSPVVGQMVWQVSRKGLSDLVEYYSHEKNILKIAQKRKIKWYQVRSQENQKFVDRAKLLLQKVGKKSASKDELKVRSQAMVEFVRHLIGSDMSTLGDLRLALQEDDFWLLASISNPQAQTTPMFRNRKLLTFSKEIGKFQGHSRLDRFLLEQKISPNLYGVHSLPLSDLLWEHNDDRYYLFPQLAF